MKINLTDEQKKQILASIHDFYEYERGEDIGIIHQEGLFNLFMDEIAPIVYNKALDDAKYWFTRKMNDIDADFYELYSEDR